MPKKIDPEVEVLVRAFSKEGMTLSQVKKRLEKLGKVISKSGIYNIIKNKGQTRKLITSGVKNPKLLRKPKVKVKDYIKKIDLWTSKENPPSQREMARRLKCDPKTVRNILKNKFEKRSRFTSSNPPISKTGRPTSGNFMKNTWQVKGQSLL